MDVCLNYSFTVTNNIKNRLLKRRVKYVYYWKILLSNNTSPFYCQAYKTGWNYSDRNPSNIFPEGETIEHGIHVYTTRKQARFYKNSDDKIIKMKCYLKDLVGYDIYSNEAVFTKVWVDNLKGV